MQRTCKKAKFLVFTERKFILGSCGLSKNLGFKCIKSNFRMDAKYLLFPSSYIQFLFNILMNFILILCILTFLLGFTHVHEKQQINK